MQYYLVVMYTMFQQYHLTDIYQDLIDYNLLHCLSVVISIYHLDLKQPSLQYYSKLIYYHLDIYSYIHLCHCLQLIHMFHPIPSLHILLYQQPLLSHKLYNYKLLFHHMQNVLQNHSIQVLLQMQFLLQYMYCMCF